MKTLFLILATIVSLSAQAQFVDLLPNHGGGFGGGLQSADEQLIQSGVAGPKYTTRWEQVDQSQAPKLIDGIVSVRLHDELVNELYLHADKNPVQISDVVLTLSNGQSIHVMNSAGTVRTGQSVRLSLHPRFSLRLERVEITMTSPSLIGSRGLLTTHVGLVR